MVHGCQLVPAVLPRREQIDDVAGQIDIGVGCGVRRRGGALAREQERGDARRDQRVTWRSTGPAPSQERRGQQQNCSFPEFHARSSP